MGNLRGIQLVVPDVDMLTELEPEELASKILFLLKSRGERLVSVSSEIHYLEQDNYFGSPASPIPRNRLGDVKQALIEAWAWLEAQGLLVPPDVANGSNGYRVLSRRARSFSNEKEFADFIVARRLPKEILHPRLAKVVWMAYMRGEFDVAVFQAMKAVVVAVREASALPADKVGVALMREAFHPDRGPLTDFQSEKGEREAVGSLFSGAIGSYKNPHSHRDVNLNDPIEALEIILLSNHLLRVVDARKNNHSVDCSVQNR